MKKILLLFSFWMLGMSVAHAQLPPGSIAPDFTATDVVSGQTYNLYDLLNEGKTVYIDIFATWCGPCWNYHNSHAMRDIWEQYGPGGTNEAFVFAIEGDSDTNIPCIFGPSGCVGGTVGDWTNGTPYPICDEASVASAYAISYYPTIYMVCPLDKKVYEVGQLNKTGLWNQRSLKCTTPAVVTELVSAGDVRCIGTSTGSINISISGGTAPHTYIWSNGAITQDLTNIPSGTYTCTVTSSNGWVGVTDPITINEPPSPLELEVVETNLPGCNGVKGSISVAGVGGWNSNYSYLWSNTQNTETAIGLNPGNYTVSVTDANGCTVSQTINLPAPIPPVSVIATPGMLTCAQNALTLDGSASSSGDHNYQWTATTGGHIVSGGDTPTPVIDATGTYTLRVTDETTTCSATSSVYVSGNTTPPTASAGAAAVISCAEPTAVLAGSGSTGAGFTYLWTASNGGNIVSGAGTLTPTVNAAGSYTLQVTNTSNGCTQTSSTTVTGNNANLTVAATGGTVTCAVPNLILTATTAAANPSYAWTGPGGFTSSAASPQATAAGDYTVVVTDAATGCAGTASATISANNAAPGATATAGALTCATTSITLSGSSTTNGVTYAWTGPEGFTASTATANTAIAGPYSLIVTNPANGCTSQANTSVTSNTTAPVAAAVAPANLNCNNAQVQINATGSSQGANYAYNWTTANGHFVSGTGTTTPVVDQAGDYQLMVTNLDNGCVSNASVQVNQSPLVAATASNTANVSCFGGNNGAATVLPSGGAGGFSILWSNGANTATITDLPAGIYAVVVTDSENCTAAANVTVAQPELLTANASATAQTANGVNDGTATATPIGGTAPFNFGWNTGATTAVISDLAPGNYTVNVTDANGCTAVQTVTVNSFNCAISATISSANITCHGANNGTASVAILGASEPVTYLWSNGATTASISGLTPGNYVVNAADNNNCPVQLNVSISEPPAVLPNATSTNETSLGANDGTATVNAVGGTGAFTYLWNNGETQAAIAGLAPGVYTVVVTDANGCTAQQSVTIQSFNCILTPVVTVSPVTCAQAANGTAVVVVNGGSAPFEFLWSNGATTSSVTNLSGGEYTVVISDANDCEISQTVSVAEPSALAIAGAGVVEPVCPDDASGSIATTVTGGVEPYTYLWSNGATTANAEQLSVGVYTLQVTDANGCDQSFTEDIRATDAQAPVLSAQNATIFVDENGVATVSLNDLSANASDNCAVANLVAQPANFDCTQLGEHTVTVTATDNAGNAAQVEVTVTVVDQIAPTLVCPASITRCSYDNIVSYPAPVATDNCNVTGGTWNLAAGLPIGSEFPVGATTQTWTYADASGNMSACSFDVIILSPVVINNVVVNASNGQANGSIDVTVTGGTSPYSYSWVSNGGVVGDSQDLVNVPAGGYQLHIIDANGCEYGTEVITVNNTVGTVEPDWAAGLRVRPNPANQTAFVDFGRAPAQDCQIQVFDATGKWLRTLNATGEMTVEISCSDWAAGLYYIKIQSGNTVIARKLTVNR